jgi:hypothetical protein
MQACHHVRQALISVAWPGDGSDWPRQRSAPPPSRAAAALSCAWPRECDDLQLDAMLGRIVGRRITGITLIDAGELDGLPGCRGRQSWISRFSRLTQPAVSVSES